MVLVYNDLDFFVKILINMLGSFLYYWSDILFAILILVYYGDDIKNGLVIGIV